MFKMYRMTEHSVRRIASLQPSVTVILDAIGELGRVVACTKYCADVVSEIAQRAPTILSDSWTADAAQIIATNPDLVIAAVPYQEKAVVGDSEGGSAVSRLGSEESGGYLRRHCCDRRCRGRQVSVRPKKLSPLCSNELTKSRKKASKCMRPRVFCEEWGKPMIASQKWVAELVEAAGGTFIGEPGRKLSPDELADLRRRHHHRRLVRRGRSSTSGKNHSRSRMAVDLRSPGRGACSAFPTNF